MHDLRKAHVTMPHHSALAWATGIILPGGCTLQEGQGPCCHACSSSRGQGAPRTAKDTPCKVCRGYLRDPTMEVVDTRTTTQARCRGQSMASKAPAWHKMAAGRLLVSSLPSLGREIAALGLPASPHCQGGGAAPGPPQHMAMGFCT